MIRISFVHSTGQETLLHGAEGESLMAVAVRHGLPGIIGECGGNCACATCHVYVRAAWLSMLPPPAPDERVMLKGALAQRPDSRLGCCIELSAALDGLQVEVPPQQV